MCRDTRPEDVVSASSEFCDKVSQPPSESGFVIERVESLESVNDVLASQDQQTASAWIERVAGSNEAVVHSDPVGPESTDISTREQVLAPQSCGGRAGNIPLEDALRESQERFRGVFEQSRIGIAIAGLDGQIIDANPAFLNMVGYSIDELRSMTFAAITHPDDRSAEMELFQDAILGKLAGAEVEKRYVRKDGRVIWVRLNPSVMPGRDSKPAFAIATVEDITQRKQAEEALRESEERFRKLADASFEGLVIHSDGLMLDTNKRITEMLGYDPAQLIGKPFWEFIDSKYHDVVKEHVQEHYSGTYEVELIHRSGARVPVEVVGREIAWHGRQVRAAALRDMTERTKAEEALRQQKELLMAVATNTKAHLVYLDRDFNFVWVNQAYADACARRQEDFIGHNHFELYPNAENQAIFEHVRDTGAPFEAKEKPFVFADHPEWGVTYWDWTLVPIKDGEGHIQSFVFSLMDVTNDVLARQEIERLRAEAELRSVELESYMASMADGVSVTDAAGNVVWANDTLRRILRVPEEEDFANWVSRYQRLTLDDEPLPLEETVVFRALRGERVIDFRYKTVTPLGDTIVLSASGAPVFDSKGQVIGATFTSRDQAGRVAVENEKQRMLEREHRTAEMLQQALIPAHIPNAVNGCHFTAKYVPALVEALVGGDFYDVFHLGEGKVAVLIGDVEGKGVRAAMHVSAARYAFRSYAFIEPSPSRVVSYVNDALCRESSNTMGMLTAFFAVIDTNDRTVTYTNAGHEPPVIRRTSGDVEELHVGAMLLGVAPNCDYPEATIGIDFGDVIVMVTDGITEARSPERGMFGKREMLRLLADEDNPPHELIDLLLEKAKEYGNGRLHDDVAILVLGFQPNSNHD
jgi:PAS domain S-box-containing protein